jgi:hypothetical protein
MTKPVWKKLMEVEPGLYWVGGNCDQPSSAPYVQCYKTGVVCAPSWFAMIGDVPELPVMEKKYREPVLPQDWGKECEFSDFGEYWVWSGLVGWCKDHEGVNSNWVADSGLWYKHARIEVPQ